MIGAGAYEGAEPVARANDPAWHVGCGAAFGAKQGRGSSVTLGKEMHLYLKLDGSLEAVASSVSAIAFEGWHSELREGLNLGGGEYFKFECPGSEVILVCNDADHAEVFIEERSEFPFYFHWREGGDGVLEQIRLKLSRSGIACEMYEDT